MPAVIFVVLNVTDAYITKMGLMAGALEINPLMASLGSSMVFKGLLAAALVFILYFFNKERILWLLNFGLLGITLWNSATCLIIDLWPLHYLMGVHASS